MGRRSGLRRAMIGTSIVVASAALIACVGDEPTTGSGVGSDGGQGDGTIGNSGFTLAASPSYVVMDPGDAPVTIQIQLARAPTFTDDVALTVAGGTPDAPPSAPSDIPQTSTMSSFTLSLLGTSTARGDFTYVVRGTSGSLTAQTNVTLHVGSVLTPDGAGLLTVSSPIIVKAWGAGGGTGCASITGGGGGFVSARFDFTTATALNVVEGTGGVGYNSGTNAGGGGGFSGVKSTATGNWLMIAAGGGGGGGTGNGGGGGGGTGQSGTVFSCYGGGGGSPSAGGAVNTCSAGDDMGKPGAALQAGNGADNGAGGPGGIPGGGAGGSGQDPNCGGGGGGGGWFGGAGSSFNGIGGGGGGGSGYVASNGLSQNLVTATTTASANISDPDYDGHAGQGGQQASPNGSNGLVVVRLVKP